MRTDISEREGPVHDTKERQQIYRKETPLIQQMQEGIVLLRQLPAGRRASGQGKSTRMDEGAHRSEPAVLSIGHAQGKAQTVVIKFTHIPIDSKREGKRHIPEQAFAEIQFESKIDLPRIGIEE